MVKMPPTDAEFSHLFSREEVQSMMREPERLQQVPREEEAERRAQSMMIRNIGINSLALLCMKSNGDMILNRYKRSGVVLQLWNFGQP